MTRLMTTIGNQFARKGFAKLAGLAIGALSLAPMAQARDRFDFSFRFDRHDRFGVAVDVVPAPVVFAPVVATDRVWVDAVYQTQSQRVWVAPVTQDACDRVWVDACYENRDVVTFHHGRRYVTTQSVLVSPGHWEDHHSQVVVTPGHYEDVQQQFLVAPGHWEDRVVAPAPVICR